MKLLEIDRDYFAFPEGMESVEEFIEFVNNNGNKFIKMTRYNEEYCVAPNFIEEDKKTVYVNFSEVNFIEEIDGNVLPRAEYERRLRKVVLEKCLDCVNFEGDPDNLDGHYQRLRLDGHCWGYRKKSENEELD